MQANQRVERAVADPRGLGQQVKDAFRLRSLVKIAALGALGFILMEMFQIPMPFAPAFMKVDFGDVPGLIGGFSMGPFAGLMIQLVKNILKLFTTQTLGVGELSNFLVGSTYIVVASFLYKRKHTKKGAVLSLIVGSLAMTTFALLSNAFFIFPAYAKAIQLDLDALAMAVGAANGLVRDYFTLMVFAVVPFNLVKTGMESLVTFLLYKRISPILKNWN